MRKVLDLSQFTQEVMEVKVSEELTLNLQKPTQAIVIEMLKFRNISEESEPETIVAALDSLCLLIINTNDKLVAYDKKAMDEMLTTHQKLLIVQTYSDFISEVQNHPN